jgi:SAM-dependent methyltransferase
VSQQDDHSHGHDDHGHYGHHHGHHHGHGEGHRYGGTAERLRSPERLALLEVGRVADLCLDGGASASVLDVGVGSGVFAEEFHKRGLSVTGVDVNPEMIEAASRHVPQGTFVEAPADALPFADGAFDLVYLGHVLHEVPDPVRALSEARRVARVRVAVLEWPYLDEEHGPPLEHRLRDEAIQAFAHDAGFEQIEHHMLAHMSLYLLAR